MDEPPGAYPLRMHFPAKLAIPKDMNNSKRYIRFWVAVILASILIALMGCYAPVPVVSDDRYFTGGCYVIEADTCYQWK